MRLPTWIVLLGSLALTVGCASLRDDMLRAEGAYEQARYEESLVWLEDLEDDVPDMDRDMRARFYYLRGMTAYRLDRRSDALHYLALARESAEDESALRTEWRLTMERTLAELAPDTAGEPSSEGE